MVHVGMDVMQAMVVVVPQAVIVHARHEAEHPEHVVDLARFGEVAVGGLVPEGAEVGHLQPGDDAEDDLRPQGLHEQNAGDGGGVEAEVEKEMADAMARVGNSIGGQRPLQVGASANIAETFVPHRS